MAGFPCGGLVAGFPCGVLVAGFPCGMLVAGLPCGVLMAGFLCAVLVACYSHAVSMLGLAMSMWCEFQNYLHVGVEVEVKQRSKQIIFRSAFLSTVFR